MTTHEDKQAPIGLALLRKPFLPHQISKLPKPLKRDAEKGKCRECGGWHGLPAIHLDYVGHAALTDRLLDADPFWSWEPVSVDDNGLPLLDSDGGLWIRLTVCGVTRLGYGDAEGKRGPAAVKERIGDALRNAAMRFGAALDLWHKGDLHQDEDAPKPETAKQRAEAKTADAEPSAVARVQTRFTTQPDENPLEYGGQEVVAGMLEAKTLAELEQWASRAKKLTNAEKAEARRVYSERKEILVALERADTMDEQEEDMARKEHA